MSAYRDPAPPTATAPPKAPSRRWRCLTCYRTDCAVHGENAARLLKRCNHTDTNDHADIDTAPSPRIPCAVCGKDPTV